MTSAARGISSKRIHQATCRAAASPAYPCFPAFAYAAQDPKKYQQDENINVVED